VRLEVRKVGCLVLGAKKQRVGCLKLEVVPLGGELIGGNWLCSGFGRSEILSQVLIRLAPEGRNNTVAHKVFKPQDNSFHLKCIIY
jgi:hypothetical protein